MNKLDAKTKQLIKDKNFEFTLYTDHECTKGLTSISSHDGIATFKSLRFGTYYIKETKAPLGYYLSQEVKKVVLDENEKEIHITFDYMNTPINHSYRRFNTDNDHCNSINTLSLISIVLLLRRKKIE